MYSLFSLWRWILAFIIVWLAYYDLCLVSKVCVYFSGKRMTGILNRCRFSRGYYYPTPFLLSPHLQFAFVRGISLFYDWFYNTNGRSDKPLWKRSLYTLLSCGWLRHFLISRRCAPPVDASYHSEVLHTHIGNAILLRWYNLNLPKPPTASPQEASTVGKEAPKGEHNRLLVNTGITNTEDTVKAPPTDEMPKYTHCLPLHSTEASNAQTDGFSETKKESEDSYKTTVFLPNNTIKGDGPTASAEAIPTGSPTGAYKIQPRAVLVIVPDLLEESPPVYVQALIRDAGLMGYISVVITGCANFGSHRREASQLKAQMNAAIQKSAVWGVTPLLGSLMEDLKYVFEYIHLNTPDIPKVAVGYSFGANVLLKYLGAGASQMKQRAEYISLSDIFSRYSKSHLGTNASLLEVKEFQSFFEDSILNRLDLIEPQIPPKALTAMDTLIFRNLKAFSGDLERPSSASNAASLWTNAPLQHVPSILYEKRSTVPSNKPSHTKEALADIHSKQRKQEAQRPFPPVAVAISVCNPIQLLSTRKRVNRSLFGYYDRRMVTKLSQKLYHWMNTFKHMYEQHYLLTTGGTFSTLIEKSKDATTPSSASTTVNQASNEMPPGSPWAPSKPLMAPPHGKTPEQPSLAAMPLLTTPNGFSIASRISEWVLYRSICSLLKTFPNDTAVHRPPPLYVFDKLYTSKQLCTDRLFDPQNPALGFYRTVKDYYADNSCANELEQIKIPTLMLHALDDPICDTSALDLYQVCRNPNVCYTITRSGGHNCFLAGWNPYFWSSKIILEFATAALHPFYINEKDD